jgi:hypothetical protein
MVFLKQFRDVADGRKAAYQAVVEAPAKVVQIRTVGPLAGPYQVTVGRFASHPIIEELGLSGGGPLTASPWFVDFDFDMENGKEIWRA